MNNTITNNQNADTTPSAADANANGKAPAYQITGADIPLALKARYFGSGVAVGVMISPLVRNALGKLQPKLSELMESLTGQAEGMVEKGSDWMAMMKQMVNRDEAEPSSERPGMWN